MILCFHPHISMKKLEEICLYHYNQTHYDISIQQELTTLNTNIGTTDFLIWSEVVRDIILIIIKSECTTASIHVVF